MTKLIDQRGKKMGEIKKIKCERCVFYSIPDRTPDDMDKLVRNLITLIAVNPDGIGVGVLANKVKEAPKTIYYALKEKIESGDVLRYRKGNKKYYQLPQTRQTPPEGPFLLDLNKHARLLRLFSQKKQLSDPARAWVMEIADTLSGETTQENQTVFNRANNRSHAFLLQQLAKKSWVNKETKEWLHAVADLFN